MRELSRCSRYSPGERSAVKSLCATCAGDMRRVPCRSQNHGGIHARGWLAAARRRNSPSIATACMDAPCSSAAISARLRATLAMAITRQPARRRQVSRSCSLCHSANASLFDGSKHKQAFDQHNWPECGKCHGNHAIAKTHDSMLATGPGQLCGDCHREFAKNNPDCIKTADYFHKTITQMDEARTS